LKKKVFFSVLPFSACRLNVSHYAAHQLLWSTGEWLNESEKKKLQNLFPVFQQFSAAKTNIKLSKANLYFSGEKCEKCSRGKTSVIFLGNKIFAAARVSSHTSVNAL
jgi:hypothetical protein